MIEIRLVGPAAAALMLLAACGTSSGHTARSSSTSATPPAPTTSRITSPDHAVAPSTLTVTGHSATYTGQLDRTFHFTTPGITLGPVSSSSVPNPDWQRAFHVCFGTVVVCVATGSATVALATANGPADSRPPAGISSTIPWSS